MTDKELTAKALPLIAERHASARRPLPWRLSPTPYRVWISEIMLQQTRIEAVMPFFERFIAEVPDIPSLAEIDENRLLKLWEGLGYYSRARNLKKAAQTVVENYDGRLPASAAELKKLPGIGDYTAGAIASIAFGLPEPAVDGNVLRVMARLLADGRDVLDPATRRSIADLLRGNYPSGEAAALVTEGLMELGETVCLPNTVPRCADCPLNGLCRAFLSGSVSEHPVRSAPKERRIEERTVLLLKCGGKTAVRRRPAKGLLAGLWEFPSLDGHWDIDAVRALFPGALSVEACGDAVHRFSHVEWRMTGFSVELPPERTADSSDEQPAHLPHDLPADTQDALSGLVWQTPESIRANYSVPTAFKHYMKQL